MSPEHILHDFDQLLKWYYYIRNFYKCFQSKGIMTIIYILRFLPFVIKSEEAQK